MSAIVLPIYVVYAIKKGNWCYITSQIIGDSTLFRLIVNAADIKVKYDLILWGHTTTKCMTVLVSTLIAY